MPHNTGAAVPFTSIRLLRTWGVSVTEIVDAIQEHGLYCQEGLTHRVTRADENAVESTISLLGYAGGEYAHLLEDEIDSVCSLRGWPDKRLPDLISAHLPKDYAKQSRIHKLLQGLLVLYFGDDILEELAQPRSGAISEIRSDLELKGYEFDEKTLRTYLKNQAIVPPNVRRNPP